MEIDFETSSLSTLAIIDTSASQQEKAPVHVKLPNLSSSDKNLEMDRVSQPRESFSRDRRTSQVAQHNRITPMMSRAGGSGDLGVDISWGGPNGVEASGHAKGEVHDDNGNYAELKAEQNSDGTGNVSISAGHKED